VQDALVHAQGDVELWCGQAQQLAVLLASPAGLGHREDLMPFSEAPLEATVHVLIQEYMKLKLLEPPLPTVVSQSLRCRRLQVGLGLLAADGRETPLQEIVEGMASLEVVDEGLDLHAGAG
jgi:hypothetical protein